MSLEVRNERDDLRLRVKELEYRVEQLTKERDSWEQSFKRLNRVFKTTSDKTIDQDMQVSGLQQTVRELREALEIACGSGKFADTKGAADRILAAVNKRSATPLANQSDQQALDEFVNEVKP